MAIDPNKPCPNCGCKTPYHDGMERIVHEKFEIGQRFIKQLAHNAETLARKELDIISLKEGQRWMQQKVRKQAAAIRRLEEKIRRLGDQPYSDTPPPEKRFGVAEIEPGMLFFKGQFLVTEIQYERNLPYRGGARVVITGEVPPNDSSKGNVS